MDSSKIKVAFNVSAATYPVTGISRYIYEISKKLHLDNQLDSHLFSGHRWIDHLHLSEKRNCISGARKILKTVIPFAYELRQLSQDWHFNSSCRNKSIDVYHEPNHLPLNFDGPTVLTVHDLSWVRHPETHPIERVRWLNKWFENGLNRASKIVVDSSFTKHELVSIFGVCERKVTVVHLGVEELFSRKNENDVRRTLEKFGLRYKSFWLSVGTLEPRKNTERLLDAFLTLPKEQQNKCPLVIVGPNGWKAEALQKRVATHVRDERVKSLGYVERGVLSDLVASAKASIYPSFYEGFGLPVLESMASGTPVICSETGFTKEIKSQSVSLFDPNSVNNLREAMAELYEDASLLKKLGLNGYEASRCYTWERCFAKTAEVYKEALNS